MDCSRRAWHLGHWWKWDVTRRRNLAGEGREQGQHLWAGMWTRSHCKITLLTFSGNSVKRLHCDHCRSYAKNEQVCVHTCVNENIGGTELGFRNEITLICLIVLSPWIWQLDIPTLVLCLWLLQNTGRFFSPRLKVQIVKKGRAMWRALKKCFKDTLKPGIGAHTYLCFLSPHSRSLYLSARINVHFWYFYQYLLHLWKASGTSSLTKQVSVLFSVIVCSVSPNPRCPSWPWHVLWPHSIIDRKEKTPPEDGSHHPQVTV